MKPSFSRTYTMKNSYKKVDFVTELPHLYVLVLVYYPKCLHLPMMTSSLENIHLSSHCYARVPFFICHQLFFT